MPIWLAWWVNILLLVLAILALRRHIRQGTSGRWFAAALALRLAGGVVLGLVYVSPWLGKLDDGGDTLTLHTHAAAYRTWATHDPNGYVRLLLTGADQPGSPARLYATYSNSFFFVRLLSVLHFLTGGDYWLSGLWLSLAAFIGSWLLARELARVVPGAQGGAYVGALAWPSALFWLSGVSKDALLLASLGVFATAALRLTYPPISSLGRAREPGVRWWVALLASGWLFWKIKFFIAAVVFVVFGALALTERVRGRWRWVRPWQLFLLLALALAPLSRVAHLAFRPEYLLIQIPRNQAALRASDGAQPELRLPLKASLGSFARNAPAAALGTFTRPWVWEGKGVRWRAAGLENAALLLLAAWAVAGWWRRGRPRDLPLLAGALLLIVVVVAVMFGLTTPNLGSLHRYRAALLPFVLVLLDWLRKGTAGFPPAPRPAPLVGAA